VRGAWLKSLLLGLVPLLFLEGIRLVVDAPFTGGGLATRWGFIAGVLVAAALTRPYSPEGTRWRWPGLLWLVPGAVVGLVYGRTGATWAAWLLVGMVYVLLLGLETVLTDSRSRLRRWAWRGLLALTAGAFPVALSQLESHFADEEFFVALEALALAAFWLTLLGLYYGGCRWTGVWLVWHSAC
jgi:uncharacterized protein YfiM (DUF2279 family)